MGERKAGWGGVLISMESWRNDIEYRKNRSATYTAYARMDAPMQGVLRAIAMDRDLHMRPGSVIGKGTKKSQHGRKRLAGCWDISGWDTNGAGGGADHQLQRAGWIIWVKPIKGSKIPVRQFLRDAYR